MHHIQHTVFHDEITNLQSRGNCSTLVRQLELFLDDDHLLYCGRHIHNAPLSELTGFPYLLPSWHQFTVLVITNAHVTQLHSGVNATLTALRQKYWIPSACQQTKSTIRYAEKPVGSHVLCTIHLRVLSHKHPVPHLSLEDFYCFLKHPEGWNSILVHTCLSLPFW